AVSTKTSHEGDTIKFTVAENVLDGNVLLVPAGTVGSATITSLKEDNDGEWFAAKWADIYIFESQHQLSPVVQDKFFQRRSHNSPYALAATFRGSGQGVMP
ncbi:hypothetical protein PZH35_13000, partial [Veillonella atypica]|nr:hypothetical protein [Veillonella atypica]